MLKAGPVTGNMFPVGAVIFLGFRLVKSNARGPKIPALCGKSCAELRGVPPPPHLRKNQQNDILPSPY